MLLELSHIIHAGLSLCEESRLYISKTLYDLLNSEIEYLMKCDVNDINIFDDISYMDFYKKFTKKSNIKIDIKETSFYPAELRTTITISFSIQNAHLFNRIKYNLLNYIPMIFDCLYCLSIPSTKESFSIICQREVQFLTWINAPEYIKDKFLIK